MTLQPTFYPKSVFAVGYIPIRFSKIFYIFCFLFLGISGIAQQYCLPTSFDPPNTYINNLKFETNLGPAVENNNTGFSYSPVKGYQDFTSLNVKAKQYPGGIINFTVVSNNPAKVKAWIDWNKDKNFDDPQELAYDSSTGNNTVTFSIMIPTETAPGYYRIRIRNYYGIYYVLGVPSSYSTTKNYSPCEPFTSDWNMFKTGDRHYGETEDYLFQVLNEPACYPPTAASATNITHSSANLNWVQSVSGPNPISYDLQWNDTGVFDGNTVLSDIAPGMNSNLLAIDGLESGKTYYYRVRSNCGGTNGKSNWSQPETFVAGGYTPIDVSGYNEDIVADKEGFSANLTSASFDNPIGSNSVLIENGSVINGKIISKGLPQNRILKNSNGSETPAELKYYLGNYSLGNVLQINNSSNTVVFTLNNPQELSEIYLAGASADGIANLNIEVVYNTGDNSQFSNINLNDWSGNDPYIEIIGSKVGREIVSLPEYSFTNPKIYQIKLENLDQERKVKEIRIKSTNSTPGSNIANILAVSAAPAGPKVLSVSSSGNFCSGDQITISATGEAAIKWYTEETGGEAIKTTLSGESWHPELNETTTLYAESNNGIFAGKRVPITITSNDISFASNDSNWNSEANWSSGELPNAESCVKIPNGKKVSVDIKTAVVKNISVEDGGKLTIEPDQTLTVTDFIRNGPNNQENFVLENGANLIQINDDAVNTGSIQAKKVFTFSAERKQYNFVNSPLVGQNLKQIYPGTTYALRYDEATDFFKTTDGSYIAGRALALKEGQTGNGDALFKGVPFNGELEFPVTKNGQGYNLVGNPYPSNLDLDKFFAANTDILTGEFQFWDNRNNTFFEQMGPNYTGGNYAFYNAYSQIGTAAGTPQGEVRIPNGITKVGSGFLVGVQHAGTVHFENSFRTDAETPEFYGKNGDFVGERDRYWLTMTTPANISMMTAVVYFEGGQDEYWFDDTNAQGSSDEIFTMTDDKQVIIQGKQSFNHLDKVPLGYRAFTEGTQIISVYKKEGVFESSQDIYLIDQLLNKTVNLSEKPYKFVSRAGEFTNRFLIVYKPRIQNAEGIYSSKNQIQFEKKDNQIVITSTIDKITNVELYNINGRSEYKKDAVNSKEHKINALRFGHQIVVVVVKTETGETVSRKFINN